MEKKKRFEYVERNEDVYEKRAAQRGGGTRDNIFKNGVNVLSIKADEEKRLRILPPTWDGPEHYGLDIWVHYGIGDERSTYLCLNRMKGEKCPICEASLGKAAIADPKYGKSLKPKRKVLVYVLDRKQEEEGVKAWAMPWQLDKNFVLQSKDEDTKKVLRIDKPNDGYDILFNTVKSLTPDIPFQYEGEKIARNSSPISSNPSLMAKVIDFIVDNPLTNILDFKSYDYIKKVFEHGVVEKDEEEIEEIEEDIPLDVGKKYEEVEVDIYDKMDRNELEDAAADLGMKPREMRNLSDDELREFLRKPVEPVEEVVDEAAKAQLNESMSRLRGKFGRKE